jgi:hypothetical protein
MTRGALLLTDNAHSSDALRDRCRRHGLDFHFWRERPIKHFYPGAGIGMAVIR